MAPTSALIRWVTSPSSKPRWCWASTPRIFIASACSAARTGPLSATVTTSHSSGNLAISPPQPMDSSSMCGASTMRRRADSGMAERLVAGRIARGRNHATLREQAGQLGPHVVGVEPVLDGLAGGGAEAFALGRVVPELGEDPPPALDIADVHEPAGLAVGEQVAHRPGPGDDD